MSGTLATELITAGGVIGLAIAAMLAIRAIIDRSRLTAGLAAVLLMAVTASGLIVASWSAGEAARDRFQLIELGLLIATGPVCVIAVAALLRVAVPAATLTAAAAALFLALVLVAMRYGGDPVRCAVPAQSAFVIYGWVLLARRRAIDARQRAYRRRLIANGLLAALTLINLASMLRLLFPDVAALRSIVPLTISLVLLALLLALLSALLMRTSSLLAPAATDSDARLLVERAARHIEEHQIYRHQELKLPLVAEALGESAARLAAALAASDWGSFATLLQSVRVDQAKTMLADPAESRTSIEAVGLLCGFRSRSVFYDAFRKQTGLSPGEYRRKSCPKSRSGQKNSCHSRER